MTVEDLARFAAASADLSDPDVMTQAWTVSTWLIDKSALVRLGDTRDAAEWASRIQRGLVRISTVTRLEVGFSARSSERSPREHRPGPAGVDARRVLDARD